MLLHTQYFSFCFFVTAIVQERERERYILGGGQGERQHDNLLGGGGAGRERKRTRYWGGGRERERDFFWLGWGAERVKERTKYFRGGGQRERDRENGIF